jgi:hypothetical protein
MRILKCITCIELVHHWRDKWFHMYKILKLHFFKIRILCSWWEYFFCCHWCIKSTGWIKQLCDKLRHMVQHILFLQPVFWWWKVNSILCLIFFHLFNLFMPMLFKTQKLDIILKTIQDDLSSASIIRYRRAEVPAKVFPFHVYFRVSFYHIFNLFDFTEESKKSVRM